MKNRIRIPAILLVSLWLTSGCGKEEAIVEEIRSIKTVTVKKASAGKMRRFSGVVRAVDSATLSFEVNGKIEKVNVDIGDRAEKQQVLAVLDKEPYVLNVKSAEAELIRAKANLVNKEADYQREKSIYEEGAGSKQRLDQARFGYKEAKAGIQYAVSRLNLAKRDLRKTILYAPYDSHIGRRYVNPHVEVKVGQPIFDIEAEGAKEVEVPIPETTVYLISVGAPTVVTFNIFPGVTVAGTISYIGTVAGNANAFPVKVTLQTPPAEVQSGMTAEVTFELEVKSDRESFLIPPQAVIPGIEKNKGNIFVYDSATSTVKKTYVQVSGVQNNLAIITEGISDGDIVVTAGVSFLSDGEKVNLMRRAQKTKPAAFELK